MPEIPEIPNASYHIQRCMEEWNELFLKDIEEIHRVLEEDLQTLDTLPQD